MARSLQVFRASEIERRGLSERERQEQNTQRERGSHIEQMIADFRVTVTKRDRLGDRQRIADGRNRAAAFAYGARGRSAGPRRAAVVGSDLDQRAYRRGRRRPTRRFDPRHQREDPQSARHRAAAPPRRRARPINSSTSSPPERRGSATSSSSFRRSRRRPISWALNATIEAARAGEARARLCGGGDGSQSACRADCQGHRGNRRADRFDSGSDRADGRGDPFRSTA